MGAETGGLRMHERIAEGEPRTRPEAIGGGTGPVRRAARLLLWATVPSALAAGCAARAGERDPGVAPGLENRIEIRIVNNNFSDARLYAVRLRGKEYIGALTGKTEANYTLEWDVPQTLSIRIELLAVGTCTTDELTVDPGETLFLRIDSTLAAMPSCRRGRTATGARRTAGPARR